MKNCFELTNPGRNIERSITTVGRLASGPHASCIGDIRHADVARSYVAAQAPIFDLEQVSHEDMRFLGKLTLSLNLYTIS